MRYYLAAFPVVDPIASFNEDDPSILGWQVFHDFSVLRFQRMPAERRHFITMMILIHNAYLKTLAMPVSRRNVADGPVDVH